MLPSSSAEHRDGAGEVVTRHVASCPAVRLRAALSLSALLDFQTCAPSPDAPGSPVRLRLAAGLRTVAAALWLHTHACERRGSRRARATPRRSSRERNFPSEVLVSDADRWPPCFRHATRHTHTPRITLRKVGNILQCHEILKLTWGELESFQKTTITPPTARALKFFFSFSIP